MNKTSQTRSFFIKYRQTVWRAVANKEEITEKFLSQFISDPKLIGHILFFNQTFPGYKLIPKEIIAAEDKVFVRVNFQGVHAGSSKDIPSIQKKVNVPFALCYTIANDKIVNFWAIANEMEFFEQLGLTKEQVEIPVH